MRVLSKISWVAFMLPLLIWSCAPIDQPTIIPQTAPSLIDPAAGTSIVLLPEDREDTLFFTSSVPDFGVPGSVTLTYKVLVGAPGGSFADAKEVGTSDNPTIKVPVAKLNAEVIGKGGAPGVVTPIELFVVTSINRSLSDLVGAAIAIQVTPYEAQRNMFLVGDATAAGWNNNNNNVPLFWDPATPDIYVYTGYFGAGAFKVLEKPGQWQPQFGTNDGSTIAVNPGGGTDPDVFPVPAAGFYTFTFNLANNTFSLVPYTGDTSVEHASVGIIGSSTPGGWDTSTPMTSRAFGGDHIWFITQTVVNGEIKFRANNTWDVNWGAKTPIAGRAILGSGDNIPIEAASYKMWFNALDGRYLFIKQ